MDPTLTYLLIAGLTQIGLVGISLALFISPFVCLSKYYPDEPAPRVVQLAYPTIRKVPFVLFVNQTVVHREWYVASISQYAGARGSTAAKVLTFATSAGGVLQLVLAILIWFYNTTDSAGSNSTIAHIRLILLLIAGIGCVLIGQAESAVLWKYGRQQQIYTEWSMMAPDTRRAELIRATQSLGQILAPHVPLNSEAEASSQGPPRGAGSPEGLGPQRATAVTSSSPVVGVEDRKIIIHPQWQKVCQSVDKNLFRSHADIENLSHHEAETPTVKHRLLTTRDFTSALINVEASTSSSPSTNRITLNTGIANGNLTGTLTSNVAFEALTDLKRFATLETPDIAPEGYVTFRAYEKGGNDIIVGGVQELIIENDESEKNQYATIHMISALLLIVCSFVAHLMIDSNSTAQVASKVLASIGLAFFVVFCLMQYIAGNYDSSIPEPITTENPGCLFHCCRCPQMEPSEYPCNKKLLGMAFIFVEMIAFGSIMASTAAEGIIMYSNSDV
jgi:hypothetical protein